MKDTILCIIITIALTLTTGCTSLEDTSTTTGMKLGIVDGSFSISVPEDYEEASSDYIDKYYTKDDTASVIVTEEPNTSYYTEVLQYYNYATIQYASTFDDFTEVSKQYVSIQQKYTALVAEFSYSIDSIEMSCYAEYFILEDTIYVVTCSAPSETYEQYKDDFVRVVDSVSIA